MHLSARQNQVKISKDELVKISACPSDKYDYSQFGITYQFRTGFILVRTNMTLETLVFLTSIIFLLSTSLIL